MSTMPRNAAGRVLNVFETVAPVAPASLDTARDHPRSRGRDMVLPGSRPPRQQRVDLTPRRFGAVIEGARKAQAGNDKRRAMARAQI